MKIAPIAFIVMLLVASVQARESKPIRCMMDLRLLSTSLVAFHHVYREYPAPATWRDELVGTSNCVLNTQRVVFIESDRQLLDPWGNAFVFVVPGKRNPDSFDLYSLGQDGKSISNGDDADDVNNWSPGHPWLYEAYGFATPEQAERRAKIIFLLPFLVFGLAIAAEVFLFKKWMKERKGKSQPSAARLSSEGTPPEAR